jgi:hypothetical protein
VTKSRINQSIFNQLCWCVAQKIENCNISDLILQDFDNTKIIINILIVFF